METKQQQRRKISPTMQGGLALCLVLLAWMGVALYKRWSGISKEEQKFRTGYTAIYAEQPKRQEALTQWMSLGVVKRIAKHGPYAELFVGQPYYKYDRSAREKLAKTVFWLYLMEDKSFRELGVLDAESGRRVAGYFLDTGFRE